MDQSRYTNGKTKIKFILMKRKPFEVICQPKHAGGVEWIPN